VIDIAPGSRDGALKYTDHALGEFFEQARSRRWFDNTLFVIAGSRGPDSAARADVVVRRRHVPMLLYAPEFIAPGRVDKIAGQIDLAPTVLGILNASYRSRFVGHDLLRGDSGGRAFVANHQKLGLFDGEVLQLLVPLKGSRAFRVAADGAQTPCREDPQMRLNAIGYYQGASELVERGLAAAR